MDRARDEESSIRFGGCEGSVTTPNLRLSSPSEQETDANPEAPISSDEIIRIEKHQIEQLVALGLGRYEAIRAVEAGIDYIAVQSLVTERGCSPGAALEIAR